MSLGKRIKQLREERELTQRILAQKLNLGASTLAMYETGKRDPDTATLAQIAAFFSVSTDYLLGLSDTRLSSDQLPHLSDDERFLLQYYRSMPENQKDIMRRVAETIVPTEKNHTKKAVE